jgi:hypothetical protein
MRHIIHVRAGEWLHLTLRGAGCRALVSLEAYGIIQRAIVGIDPAEDEFTYDVIGWLREGRNTLTVVLIGTLATSHSE